MAFTTLPSRADMKVPVPTATSTHHLRGSGTCSSTRIEAAGYPEPPGAQPAAKPWQYRADDPADCGGSRRGRFLPPRRGGDPAPGALDDPARRALGAPGTERCREDVAAAHPRRVRVAHPGRGGGAGREVR